MYWVPFYKQRQCLIDSGGPSPVVNPPDSQLRAPCVGSYQVPGVTFQIFLVPRARIQRCSSAATPGVQPLGPGVTWLATLILSSLQPKKDHKNLVATTDLKAVPIYRLCRVQMERSTTSLPQASTRIKECFWSNASNTEKGKKIPTTGCQLALPPPWLGIFVRGPRKGWHSPKQFSKNTRCSSSTHDRSLSKTCWFFPNRLFILSKLDQRPTLILVP